MNKIVIAILACMSLSMLAPDALQTSEDMQEQKDSKETTVDIQAKRGHRGHRGHGGHKGHHGRRGATGSQGPAGTAVTSEFSEAYVLLPAGAPITIPPDTPMPVAFNAQGPQSSNISYDSGTQTFTVLTDGTYTIDYGVTASTLTADAGNPLDVMQIYLLLNHATNEGATNVLATQVTNPEMPFSSFAQASNQVTLALAAGTTFQLYISTAQANPFIPYYGLPGNGLTVDNEQAAYISIQKIG